MSGRDVAAPRPSDPGVGGLPPAQGGFPRRRQPARWRACLAALAGPVFLSILTAGCGGPVPVKDAAADPDRSRRDHLQDCLDGGRCKLAALSSDERSRVESTLARMNHEACLRGEGACDEARLTEAQRQEVRVAADARNFELCRSGLPACDPARLTLDQREEAKRAYDERNFRGCMNAVGTLLACDPDTLSAEQRLAVRRRNDEVNFWICRTGAFGCREDLLSDAQRALIVRPAPPSP